MKRWIVNYVLGKKDDRNTHMIEIYHFLLANKSKSKHEQSITKVILILRHVNYSLELDRIKLAHLSKMWYIDSCRT